MTFHRTRIASLADSRRLRQNCQEQNRKRQRQQIKIHKKLFKEQKIFFKYDFPTKQTHLETKTVTPHPLRGGGRGKEREKERSNNSCIWIIAGKAPSICGGVEVGVKTSRSNSRSVYLCNFLTRQFFRSGASHTEGDRSVECSQAVSTQGIRPGIADCVLAQGNRRNYRHLLFSLLQGKLPKFYE